MNSSRATTGLFLLLVLSATFIVLIPTRPVYAYSASCKYGTVYTDQYIQDTVSSATAFRMFFSTGAGGVAPPLGCTQADKKELSDKVRAEYQKFLNILKGPDSAERDIAIAKMGGLGPTTPGCDSWQNYLTSFTCWGRTFSVLIGTALITLTAWLLAVSGMLFNLLVDHTIITFGGGIYALIKDGVEIAWTALRDIANILIIGMFTFIAISIIIGLKEYGQKKLIARVLIIAVLINFSLLFTKMIVDASNYTATQFYSAAGLTAAAGKTTGVEFTEFSQAGISGQFISLMGVPSISATYNALSNAAFGKADNNYSTANGWTALLHGLAGATMLLAAALVLLYGSYLLVTRMLMVIFLMISASVAFASHLIPRWSDSSYGWSTWWSALLRSAVLAPFLMIFLWISLTVGSAVKAKGSGGSLGDLMTNPGKAANLEALFVYIVVLGLLLISFKLSSYWAGKISGFSIAGMIPGTGIGIAGQLAGMLGRNTAGWAASRTLSAMKRTAYGYRDAQGNWVQGQGATALTKIAMKRLDSLRKTTFNPLQTKPVASIATSAFGVPKGLTGKKPGEGGFEGVMARKAKAADDAARAIGPSDEQKEAQRRDDVRRERERRLERQETARQTIEGQRRLIAEIKNREKPAAQERAKQSQEERPQTELRLQQQQSELARAESDRIVTRDRQQTEMRTAARIIDQAQRQAMERRHAEELAPLIQREREAKNAVMGTQEALTNLDRAANALADAEMDRIPEVQEKNGAIREIQQALADEKTPDQIAQARQRERDIDLRKSLLWDKRASTNIEGEMRAHQRRQNWADFRAAIPPGERGNGDGAAPPAPPPAAPAH